MGQWAQIPPRPRELLRRCLLAPSLLAHFVFAKYAMGLPLFRLESSLGKDGISLDRGSMSRWAEGRHPRRDRRRNGQGCWRARGSEQI